MKRINKSSPPNLLTEYYANNPSASWKEFRLHNTGADYNAVRAIIFSDQGEICAYCEKSVAKDPIHKRCIEHYHSKSDKSVSSINWALKWNNVIGVCPGGSRELSESKKRFPTPSNLSCDQFKAHLEKTEGLSTQCEGNVLNPLDISAHPVLFDLDKTTGELLVNSDACSQYEPHDNNYSSVDDLVLNTIRVFNLNCDRLNIQRLQIFYDYQRKLKYARKKNDRKILSRISIEWLGNKNKWKSFFTTRQIILGCNAKVFSNEML